MRAMGRVLVTGGAGYVGSHVVRFLVEAGHEVVVLDDLSTGHRSAVPGDTLVDLVEEDYGDPAALDRVLAPRKVSAVIHVAGSSSVAESMADPGLYYRNNVVKTIALLDAVKRHGVGVFVFTSSAAVYGEPSELPLREEHPTIPTSPYGESKLAVERLLAWHHRAHGLKYAALRCVNVGGAHPSGALGEDHGPREPHLIPRLLRGVVHGSPATPIFGEDYPTSDGTCVRDFVHVADVAQGHRAALHALERGTLEAGTFNLANGEGFSVKEVIATVARVTGKAPPTERAPRRAGDPAILVASAERARRRLGWEPTHRSLEEIVVTAWRWHRERPSGYEDREPARLPGPGARH
jgi:UDP-glucose 4-epimerase